MFEDLWENSIFVEVLLEGEGDEDRHDWGGLDLSHESIEEVHWLVIVEVEGKLSYVLGEGGLG